MVKTEFASTPVKSAAVFTAQGTPEADKYSTSVPGGIPAPEFVVARSNVPKVDRFSPQEAALDVIRALVNSSPAGLLGSLVTDISDLSYAHLDVDFLREIQAADERKKGTAQGAVAHAIGDALAQELATYHAEKYASRAGVTSVRDMTWGETANRFVITTHAEMLDGHNSRTGSWTAAWNLHVENVPGVTRAEMSGTVEARAWCYESCTAHMLALQTFETVSLHADEENPIARVIKNQIVQWEIEVMETLDAVYGDEMDGTLKAIRRTLPITRTRLKWELIAHRAVKNPQHKKKKKWAKGAIRVSMD